MGVVGKTLRFTGGLAIGAAIGAVVAMLVAPQSGQVTTDQIRQRLNSILAAGKDAQQKREHELQAYWEQEIKKPEKAKAQK